MFLEELLSVKRLYYFFLSTLHKDTPDVVITHIGSTLITHNKTSINLKVVKVHLCKQQCYRNLIFTILHQKEQ